MFNLVEATDHYKLRRRGLKLEDEKKEKIFLPSKLCFISSDGHEYGPFGADSPWRIPVKIQIDNGDVLAQATSSFHDERDSTFKNCFSFYVSNET